MSSISRMLNGVLERKTDQPNGRVVLFNPKKIKEKGAEIYMEAPADSCTIGIAVSETALKAG